ncbi:hypothetical protein NPX13_g2142 [Xylaria arbuscula]|uniref:Uncharacterized protein n=1 Tax=Xylaria arbuscula TaxID=114810 RepID=A0A9W8TQM8_9PEZI|nr:hypothetical protein NPX13_g2142 [Xylaria arbuscula]
MFPLRSLCCQHVNSIRRAGSHPATPERELVGQTTQTRPPRRFGDYIEHTTQKVLNTCSDYYCPDWYRSDSSAAAFCRSRCEQQEQQCLPLRCQTSTKEDVSTQPDVSLSSASEPATGSSCEQCTTPASTSALVADTNEDPAACAPPVDRVDDDSVCLTNEGPSSARTQQGFRGDETPVQFEDRGQAAAESQGYPNTEYYANLLAASEDCRDLFKEFYERIHGDAGKETDASTDTYWKWDQKRQQWFHEDPDTHSVVWFRG